MKKKLSLVKAKEVETHMTPWGKVWTRGADVLGTFKRTGWTPPTEYRNDYNFRINREGGKLNEVS
jgi:hypothetical protein